MIRTVTGREKERKDRIEQKDTRVADEKETCTNQVDVDLWMTKGTTAYDDKRGGREREKRRGEERKGEIKGNHMRERKEKMV